MLYPLGARRQVGGLGASAGGGGLGPELITDWDMELAGVANWDSYGAPTTREKSSAEAYAGSQSLHIVAGAASTGAQVKTGTLILENGETYRISVWIKCVSGTAYVYDNFENIGLKTTGGITATTWTEVTVDRVAATTVARQLLIIGSAAAEIYFDNVSVRKVL